MELILILAGHYLSCITTREIWQQACREYAVKLDIYNLDDQDGQNISQKYALKSFPALIVNGKIAAVGHPDIESARKIIAKLITEIG